MPATPPVKVTGVVSAPLHTVWFVVVATVGVGFTVMVKLAGVPAQPDADGVTVMVAAEAEVPLLTAVKDAILPVPDEASPIEVFVLDHA